MSKYVRDKSHCKHQAYTSEEIDNIIQAINEKLEKIDTLASEEYVNERTQPEIITVCPSATQSTLTDKLNYCISTDSVVTKVGTKLTTSEFTRDEQTAIGVLIPDGVSKIKASANILMKNGNSSGDAYIIGILYKIDSTGAVTVLARGITPSIKPNAAASVSLSPTIAQVNPGEIVFIAVTKSSASDKTDIQTSGRTYLTVEIVKE